MRVAVRRSARLLDRHRIGRTVDHVAIVGRQHRTRGEVAAADDAERARPRQLVGDQPKFVAFTRLGGGADPADRKIPGRAVDREDEGRRTALSLQHRDILRRRRGGGRGLHLDHLRPRFRANALRQESRLIDLDREHRDQCGCDRACRHRNAAPASEPIRKLDHIRVVHDRGLLDGHGSDRRRFRQHQRRLRFGMLDRGLDVLPDDRPRLDRPHHLVQHAKPEFPGLHDRREIPVDGHHGLDLSPLVSIEGAERVFRGERDMVFAVSHHLRSRCFTVQGIPGYPTCCAAARSSPCSPAPRTFAPVARGSSRCNRPTARASDDRAQGGRRIPAAA